MSRREAWIVSFVLLVAALLLAALVGRECFVIAALAAVFTAAYSLEPLRMKRRGLWANVTIAIPRGVLLKVCGWSAVKDIVNPEPWLIGSVFGLFLLGATTTKDFADMKGDRVGGCRTLPVVYGPRVAAYAISPFFILPFVGLAIAAGLGWFTGSRPVLIALGIGLALFGAWVVRGVLRDPDALARTGNHPAWTRMYLMMIILQLGFIVAYLIPHATGR